MIYQENPPDNQARSARRATLDRPIARLPSRRHRPLNPPARRPKRSIAPNRKRSWPIPLFL